MIDRTHDLPVSRQAQLLEISRGSVYYLPRPVSAEDLATMRRLDELHLALPFMGARMLRDTLRGEGVFIGRNHVATLMMRMGIEPLYPRPRTSRKKRPARAPSTTRAPPSAPSRRSSPAVALPHEKSYPSRSLPHLKCYRRSRV
jgi:hypothetical protein